MNKAESIRWYKKGAESGDPEAQSNLGAAYFIGEGVSIDKKEAIRWYKKSAEQGNVGAMFNLGTALLSSNRPEGIKWLKTAANNGCQEALDFLS